MKLNGAQQKLCTVLYTFAQHWLDPHNFLRQQAINCAAAEYCLSPASFTLVLDWIFQQWTLAQLQTIMRNNPFAQVNFAVQILAGNTPAMLVQGLLQAVVLGIAQYIKIPARRPMFANLIFQSMLEYLPHLAQLLLVSDWHNNLGQLYSGITKADLVITYGSDETIAVIKQYLAPGAKYKFHGHRISAAVIERNACNVDTLANLAYDFLAYDQRGCLSPRVAFIQTGGAISPEHCTKLFAEKILPQYALLLPQGGLFAGEAQTLWHQRSIYGCYGPLYCGQDWTVSYFTQNYWPAVYVPRFMIFMPFTTSSELIALLQPVQSKLLTLGIAGSKLTASVLSRALQVKMCMIGHMQQQMLLW